MARFHGLGSLTLLPNTVKTILDKVDTETVIGLGTDVGSSIPSEYFRMRGMPMNRDTACYLVMKTLGEHNRWFTSSYH